MTVSSATNKVSYSGNGSLTTFAYTFKIFDEDDLTVILRAADGTETLQTITTNYSVTGVGDAGGGNVEFVTAPSATETVVIIREMDLTQGLDLVPNDPFPAQSLEDGFDRLTFMVQQHEEALERTIKASKTNTLAGSEFTISASDRANKVFSFDSNGDLAVTQELGVNRGNWAVDTSYNERDIVRDTSDGSIYIVNSAHTSSGSEPLDTNTNSSKYDVIFDVGDMTVGTVTMDALTVTGDTTLGDGTNDDLLVNARINSDLIPKTDGTRNLGVITEKWNRVYTDEVREANVYGPNGSQMYVTANGKLNLQGTSVELQTGPSTREFIFDDSSSARLLRIVGNKTSGYGDVRIYVGNYSGGVAGQDEEIVRLTYNSGGNTLFEVMEDFQVNRDVFFGYNTQSTNTSTGTLVTNGGVGIAKNLNVGEDLAVTGTSTFSGGVLGVTNFDDTTSSTTTATGAVVIDGGVGIAENLNVGGNLVLGGDLTVNGTTTTLNSSELQIDDKNITIASGAADAAAANGAGITIDGANATITYGNTLDDLTINKTVLFNNDGAMLLNLRRDDAGVSSDAQFAFQQTTSGNYEVRLRPHTAAKSGKLTFFTYDGGPEYGGYKPMLEIGDLTTSVGTIQQGINLDSVDNGAHIAVAVDDKAGDIWARPSALRFGTKGIIAMAANGGDERIHIRGDYDTTTTASAEVIWTVDYADVEGGELLIIADNGTDRQVTKLLFVHDGTTVTTTQYGNVRTGSSDLASYSMAIENTDELRLKATGAAAETIDYTVHTVGVKVA